MKVVNLLLAVAVSLLMGLLVFEGGLRLIGMGPPKTLNTFDPDRGWANKPDETITRKSVEGFKVTYAFNEHGMRDDADLEPAKPAGTRRVVALGDSFTLGLTVSRNDLFVDLLEDWWNAEGRGVQVVNTGTEAYSTDQQVAWLEAHGDEWKPDVVLIFPYENDVYWNGQTSYTGLDKPRFTAAGELEERELENHMDRGFLGNTAIGRLFSGGGNRPATFEVGGTRLLEEFGVLLDTPPEFMADPVARTTGALKALKRRCDALGARALVVPIPSHSCVDPEFAEKFEARLGLDGVAWSGDRPVEIFLDAAAAAGLESLDVRDAFREKTEAGEDLYFFKDWHINPAGNHELAELVHAELDELGWLPAAKTEVPLEPAGEAPGHSPVWPWVYGVLTLLLGTCYSVVYKKTERFPLGFLKVAALLAVIFTIAIGGTSALALLPPAFSRLVLVLVILAILGFVLYKLGDRVGTITELLGAFIGRGHWYLMPLVTVLLTIGSLLVVAASSPLVAPFIYTLF